MLSTVVIAAIISIGIAALYNQSESIKIQKTAAEMRNWLDAAESYRDLKDEWPKNAQEIIDAKLYDRKYQLNPWIGMSDREYRVYPVYSDNPPAPRELLKIRVSTWVPNMNIARRITALLPGANTDIERPEGIMTYMEIPAVKPTDERDQYVDVVWKEVLHCKYDEQKPLCPKEYKRPDCDARHPYSPKGTWTPDIIANLRQFATYNEWRPWGRKQFPFIGARVILDGSNPNSWRVDAAVSYEVSTSDIDSTIRDDRVGIVNVTIVCLNRNAYEKTQKQSNLNFASNYENTYGNSSSHYTY